MNQIGIIGAMDEEVKILQERMETHKVMSKASMEFHSGTLYGKDVIIVRSGIGKVNAAICAQVLIDKFKVEGIINTGVAGSLRNEINIGDIVLSEDALQHDVDARGFGYPLGVIPRMEESIFAADDKMLDLAMETCREVNPDIQVFQGRIITGDQFISEQKKKKSLAETFHGYCTEMEGAAIAQVAYLNKIPYLVIRAISDKADNSAEMDYSEFEMKAIEHTVKLMSALLQRL